MERYNCQNCGAPIESAQCPYCGTMLYDFVAMDSDKPAYIRINLHGRVITFSAVVNSADLEYEQEYDFGWGEEGIIYGTAPPRLTVQFNIVPDSNKTMYICENRRVCSE